MTNKKKQKKTQKASFFFKRMSRIIHERMQTFAYVHQIGRMRILGTMLVYDTIGFKPQLTSLSKTLL